jgi:hypothetical protein
MATGQLAEDYCWRLFRLPEADGESCDRRSNEKGRKQPNGAAYPDLHPTLQMQFQPSVEVFYRCSKN